MLVRARMAGSRAYIHQTGHRPTYVEQVPCSRSRTPLSPMHCLLGSWPAVRLSCHPYHTSRLIGYLMFTKSLSTSVSRCVAQISFYKGHSVLHITFVRLDKVFILAPHRAMIGPISRSISVKAEVAQETLYRAGKVVANHLLKHSAV